MSDKQLAVQEREQGGGESAALMQIISQNASNPDFDAAKMQAIVDVMMQIQANEKRARYDKAMAGLQQELPVIKKDQKGHKGKYASIENISGEIGPLLRKFGFHFTFSSDPIAGTRECLITGKLYHSGGHVEVGTIPIALDTSDGKTPPQASVSTAAYGRRNLKIMMLDLMIAGDDKDGFYTKPITEDQALTIETLIGNIPDQPAGYRARVHAKILAAMNVESISTIPSSRYGEAVKKLEIAAEKGPTK